MLLHKLVFLIALAIAANLDNLGVGIAYGLSRRHISVFSNLVIALLSGVLTFGSMVFGQWVAQKISVQVANDLGAIIIIWVGVWIYFDAVIEPIWLLVSDWFWQHLTRVLAQLFPSLAQGWHNRDGREAVPQSNSLPNRSYRREFRFIDLKETMILGGSLALNAMAGGFGASLAGHNAFFISVAITAVSYITIDIGQRVSKTYFSKWLGPLAQKVAGLLLILIGGYELLF